MNDAVTKRPSASDPLRGSYHGTWLTPSAQQYRIHPERRLGAHDEQHPWQHRRAQIVQFGVSGASLLMGHFGYSWFAR